LPEWWQGIYYASELLGYRAVLLKTMRVFLATEGSRGDVQPFLALAIALKARGHQVALAATPDFADEAERLGVSFHGFGRHVRQVLREQTEILSNPINTIRYIRDNARRSIRAQFEVLPHAKGADLIVGASLYVAGSSIADALGVPYRYIAYTPQLLRSAAHPPPLVTLQTLPGWVNRACWGAYGWLMNRLMRGAINDQRSVLGLRPLADVVTEVTRAALVAADADLEPLPADIASAGHVATGSWHMNDDNGLSPEVEAFLGAGSPPVYVGFGSMPDARPEKTTRAILDAVEATGQRAIVCAGWSKIGDGATGDRVLAIDGATHSKLFPRMAAIVHHGGAGTTAAAARAGVPQIVVPHAFDQFRWAYRVEQAGIGPKSLKRTHLSAKSLATRIAFALRDARVRERAAQMGIRVRARDGLSTAVLELERAVSSVGTRHPQAA
jgi:vancomycin aglycone glucosyltransferase